MFKQKKRPSLHAHRTGSSEAWLRANATRGNTVQLKTRLQEKDSELGSAGRHTPAGAQRIVGHFPLHAPRDTAAPTGDDALRGDFIQKPPVAQAA